MSAPPNEIMSLPDLVDGVPSRSLPAGASLVGRVGDEAVLVLRTSDGLWAIQATCPHYCSPWLTGVSIRAGSTARGITLPST